MYDKHLIKDNDGAVVAVKRNDANGKIVIGGHRRFRTLMERIITDYIGRDIPKNIHSQRGRVRFELEHVRIEQWNNALTMMGDDWHCERVERHGRIL